MKWKKKIQQQLYGMRDVLDALNKFVHAQNHAQNHLAGLATQYKDEVDRLTQLCKTYETQIDDLKNKLINTIK